MFISWSDTTTYLIQKNKKNLLERKLTMTDTLAVTGGYLTKFEDFFLGHTGQDCASVCFSVGRSCSASLDSIGEDIFLSLGVSCQDLPPELDGATKTRYPFPGWISAPDNLYFGSCFNKQGATGDVSCTEKWSAGSRICECIDERSVEMCNK